MKLVSFALLLSFWSLSAQEKPNILIIYADDLGYGDLECYNSDGKIPTPHLNKLADEGMLFRDAHSSSAVCTPSRYTLLTGRYHWRSKLQKGIVALWGKPIITPERKTVASIAKSQGYNTACIGKWHLGWDWPIPSSKLSYFQGKKGKQAIATDEQRKLWHEAFSKPIKGGPLAVGFDYYFGTDVPNWPPYCFIENERTIGIPTEFADSAILVKNQASKQGPALKGWTLEPILPALENRVVDYLEEQSERKEPFLLYMPLTSPHTPLSVNKEWLGKSDLSLYADFVMETDAVVGAVLKKLESTGQMDNTLVIFTSDNGCAHYIGAKDMEKKGHFPSGGLRGYKSDAWEGGHRVPFIVKWPKGKVQAGSKCDQLIHQADIFMTIADVLNVEVQANVAEDSFSFLSTLTDKKQTVRKNAVSCSMKGVPSIRQGDWKLIYSRGSGGWTKGDSGHDYQLYNLSNDLAEQNNLALKMPEKVKELQVLMESLIRKGRSNLGPVQKNDVAVKRY